MTAQLFSSPTQSWRKDRGTRYGQQAGGNSLQPSCAATQRNDVNKLQVTNLNFKYFEDAPLVQRGLNYSHG